MISSKMTGEISMPPIEGRNRRIGFSAGSVSAFKPVQIERTRSLYIFTTLKAISQDACFFFANQ